MDSHTQPKTWRERRKQVRLAQWERTRTQGKTRFVIRGAFLWGGTMILFMSLMDYYYDHTLDLKKLLWTAIYFVLAAPIITLATWWSNEGMRTSANLDARMKSIEEQFPNDET